MDAGRPDLAERVLHVSVIEGDGTGYDIKSFTDHGEVRYLEVKTTRNGPASGFFTSPNELAFSQAHPLAYVLVRVFHFNEGRKSGHCYRKVGSLSAAFSLAPSQYRVSL